MIVAHVPDLMDRSKVSAAAQAAGCTEVLARSAFLSPLPDLLGA